MLFRPPAAIAAVAMIAALPFSMPAVAAETPAAGDETIIVEATVERDIKEFVDAVIDVSNFDKLSRFERAICPAAAGITDAQKIAVVERIRTVAKAAGLAVGGKDCQPNVLLLVASDKKALITEFVDRYPGSMRDLSKSERRALVNSTEPAVAWHMQGALLNRDGVEIGEPGSDDAPVNRTSGSASRLTQSARPQFAAAVVVIDSAELTGLSTTQLADYAAMRAFLVSDPAKLKGTSAQSILKILDAPDDSEVPLSLTEWDLNALRGFYSVNRNTSVASQRSAVREQVKDEVMADEKEKDQDRG